MNRIASRNQSELTLGKRVAAPELQQRVITPWQSPASDGAMHGKRDFLVHNKKRAGNSLPARFFFHDLDYTVHVVACIYAVPFPRPAPDATMHDDISLIPHLNGFRFHHSGACFFPVPRVYVNVFTPKAKRTMVRKTATPNGFPALFANEIFLVFPKCLRHDLFLQKFIEMLVKARLHEIRPPKMAAAAQ